MASALPRTIVSCAHCGQELAISSRLIEQGRYREVPPCPDCNTVEFHVFPACDLRSSKHAQAFFDAVETELVPA
jgi:NAD-dependent SIR2 family protein deacetylase